MRILFIAFVIFWLPFNLLAQTGSISGKIVNADSKAGVAKASVFLSNATFGTATADDGSYSLRGIKPGQYDLVVTTVGFEEYTQRLMVGVEPISLNIQLKPKTMMMRAVTIISNADWKKNYEQFKKEFIGTNDNAKLCKVINPHVVDLIYHRKTETLEASADEFLVVENKALGYRTKFLLNRFISDKITNTIQYAGKVLFEDLPGSESQRKKWKQRRDDAYYGSPQQFYRSLYKNTLLKDGFIIYSFNRNPNPQRFPEGIIQKKIKQFRATNRDSAMFWLNQEDVPKWINETLMKPPLTEAEILRTTPENGIYAVSFPNYLYVVYTKKHEDTYFKDVFRPLDMENFETSVVTLYSPRYIVFDKNGTVISASPLYEGTWSKAKLANMLPIDYEPGD